MTNVRCIACISVLAGLTALAGCSAATAPGGKTLNSDFPGLTPGCLTYARLESLPTGVLLQSGNVAVTEKELAAEIAEQAPFIREQCERNSVFVLEQFAKERLLLAAARQQAATTGRKPSTQPDRAIIQQYLQSASMAATVPDAEAKAFFEQNRPMFADASFGQVRDDLKAYLASRQEARATASYIQTLGQRLPIAISGRWVRQEAAKMRENPLDEARANGRPTLVAFGTGGCCGPDLAPILAEVEQQFQGKVNVVFINVKEAGVLAARFGIEDVPAEIFYDKSGREAYRHDGLLQAEQMAERLTRMGVK